jgi:hypothetical protein
MLDAVIVIGFVAKKVVKRKCKGFIYPEEWICILTVFNKRRCFYIVWGAISCSTCAKRTAGESKNKTKAISPLKTFVICVGFIRERKDTKYSIQANSVYSNKRAKYL